MSVTNRSFGRVCEPTWENRTVYLIGGGPSLKGFDLERLRGCTTVAVNDSALHAPWTATALFSLDRKWMSERRETIQAFSGEVYLAVADDFSFDEATSNATYLLRQRNSVGLSTDPGVIHMGGGNSGFGAFNLAFLKRARKIVLLGYDYRNAHYHWFKDYPWSRPGSSTHSALYGNWAKQFSYCAGQLRGVTVLNASATSAITAFPKITLESIPL